MATELKNEMPELKEFSERNIGYMIRFAREYGSAIILQQPAAKVAFSKVSPESAPKSLAI